MGWIFLDTIHVTTSSHGGVVSDPGYTKNSSVIEEPKAGLKFCILVITPVLEPTSWPPV